MTAALAALAEAGRRGGIEEDYCLGCQCPAFGRAKRQRVDPTAPGHLGRRRIEPDQRIGKAGAVHVHRERSLPCDLRKRGDLVGPVNGAGLGGLRDRQRRWNNLMRTVPAIAGERLAEAIGGELAGRTLQADKLEAISEKFGRSAFVGENVRPGMTENGAPGWRDLRQGQSVCRRAGWHQESRHLTFEDLAEPALGRLCPIIIAIAARVAAACLGQSIENGGCDRRRVVASKVHLWRTWRELRMRGGRRNGCANVLRCFSSRRKAVPACQLGRSPEFILRAKWNRRGAFAVRLIP